MLHQIFSKDRIGALQTSLDQLLKHRRQEFACIRQFSEEDCGAACIATICEHHGRQFSLGKVREAVGTMANGTTLLGLKRGAEQLGLIARAAKADATLLESIEELPLPVICHWDGNHWVVLHGRDQDHQLIVADPAVGLRKLSEIDFVRHWQNGILLLVEPDPARFQQAEHEETRPGLWVFGQFITPFKGLLLQALMLNIVIGSLALGMPVLMQILTDDVLVRGDTHMLTALSAGIMVLTALRYGLGWVQGQMVGHFGQKLQLQMILHYGQRLFQLPINYFEGHRSGEVVSRISDIQRINELLTAVVTGLPSQLCIAAISLLWMLSYSVPLAIAAVACYAAVVVCNLCFLPLLQKKTKQLLVGAAENQGYLVEVFRAATVLKTTEATPQAWQEYQRNFGRLARLSWAGTQLRLSESTTTGLLGGIGSIALLWYGSSFVINSDLSIGQLLAFNGMGANVLAFLTGLSAISQEAITASVVLRRLSEVMEREPEDQNKESKHYAGISSEAPILCKNITWHYPGRRALLDDFTLEIPGGVTTALIGQSGCGKSSISKLIAGFYPPERGTIHYGSYSSQDLTLECIRRQVVLVPQESHFFNRSIYENFVFSHPGISFAEVVESCRLALADEFIHELPDGYGTVLGEFGANLSGGQRQRLALARALINDPPVLILDESTSALDPVLEQRLMNQLLNHRQGKTTIMVSHRPSVILRADWIVYIDQGKVKQQDQPSALKESLLVSPYLKAH
ncbi:MAG: peptidase domain-containing ABC transporter [Vulcanococcus sp.]|nr:peptidase domain-containing ABC transporter [Vulcanococcus sp.]